MPSTPHRVCPQCGQTRRFVREKCKPCRDIDDGEYTLEQVERMLQDADKKTWNLPNEPEPKPESW